MDDDERYEKELQECSEKGIEISEECKTYFKKKFEQNNNDTGEKNNDI